MQKTSSSTPLSASRRSQKSRSASNSGVRDLAVALKQGHSTGVSDLVNYYLDLADTGLTIPERRLELEKNKSSLAEMLLPK